jgi:glycerophosphoryl diester phosphodiesterase
MNHEERYADIPPMFKNRYMAHALGGYQGFTYLNCEEGLLNAILHGYRFIEVDLLFTEDGELVCSHGWTEELCEVSGMPYRPEFEHMTRECFLRQKVRGFTTMDAARLYQYMVMFPDIYWELDLHTLPKAKAVRMAEKILEVFEHNEDVLNRCMVQVNSAKMFEAIDSVWHFRYYQFNIKSAIEKLDEYIEFSVKNGIQAMAMRRIFASEENIKKVRNAGLALLVFIVDNWDEAARYLGRGANTICTNFIVPEEDKNEIRAKITYNSTPRAGERVTELMDRNILRGTFEKTMLGSNEYTEDAVFSRDGFYRLTANLFHKGMHRFLGWNLRRKNEQAEWEWYCADGQWITEDVWDGEPLCLFEDCAVIRKELIALNGRLFFAAVWKGEKEVTCYFKETGEQ